MTIYWTHGNTWYIYKYTVYTYKIQTINKQTTIN